MSYPSEGQTVRPQISCQQSGLESRLNSKPPHDHRLLLTPKRLGQRRKIHQIRVLGKRQGQKRRAYSRVIFSPTQKAVKISHLIFLKNSVASSLDGGPNQSVPRPRLWQDRPVLYPFFFERKYLENRSRLDEKPSPRHTDLPTMFFERGRRRHRLRKLRRYFECGSKSQPKPEERRKRASDCM